ncbi:extracellular solute-binding protein [Paenibacillus filicis]|uniref:Extracellular solute-binding protein n=1 Tax=Paenibacillus filicis TaxID=669464 RepID=A0ABU9DDC8_9BACL
MKKIVSSVLAGTLAVSAAGCSSAPQETGGTQGGTATAGPTKFSISITSGSNAYAESSPNINEDKWVKKLEQLANVDMDIRLIPHKEFNQKMAVMFAGNDIPDAVQTVGGATGKAMAGSVEAGLYMPLDDLLKEYAPTLLKNIPKEAWAETSYQGKIYGIPAWLSNPSRRALFIRTDLLEKAGLQAPKTLDELLNVMRAFKKLGVEHPYQMRENFKYADTFFGSFDAIGSQFEVKDGQVVPKFFDSENMMKALQTYKTMFDEGLIPKDFATISSGDYGKNIQAGKAGMWSANAEGLTNYRTKIVESVPDVKIDIIPAPKGPEGYGGHLLYSPVTTSTFINKKVSKEKAIGIIKFLEWMQSDEAQNFFSFGNEGENYTKEGSKINFKQPKTKEEVDEDIFRSNTLWFIRDAGFNRVRSEMTKDGQDLMKAFDNVLGKEGLGSVMFTPDLTSFATYPDLAPQGSDTPPKLIVDHMIKMIYGKEPISDWPKVVEEWKSKGGNDIVKEASERYAKKEGVNVLENRK